MDKVILFGAVMWTNPYSRSKRGWPNVLYWRKLAGSGYDEQDQFLRDFYRDCEVNEIPLGYGVAICMKDTKPYKPQNPERVLKQRMDRLDKRMEEKFPLFADEFKAEHKAAYKDRYDMAAIAVEQQERKELVESTDPEVSLPAQMAGNDSWKRYDWKAIHERLRRIMFANKRHVDPGIMARAMQKERTGNERTAGNCNSDDGSDACGEGYGQISSTAIGE